MKRNIIITFLSLLLAAVTIGSLLFTPSAAQNRLRPIPAHAQLVYNNQTPDGFLSFFPNIGKIGNKFSNPWNEKFQTLEKDSALAPRSAVPQRSWFQSLENQPLAVATVPFNGRERRDGWVAVSKLGGPTALLFRWRLLLFPPEGVSPSRPYAAWPVWKLEHPAIPGWARVRFSLTDGLLICSISDDSHDIHKLLDTLDGRAASLADRKNGRVER